MAHQTTPAGWILYDASCGVCSRWVPFWAPTLRSIGLDIAPLQADWVASRMSIDEDALLRDILLLRADGTVVSGASAYRAVMRAIWWAYPFYVLVNLPGFRWIFDRSYRAFADHRLAISRVCHLPPEAVQTSTPIQSRA